MAETLRLEPGVKIMSEKLARDAAIQDMKDSPVFRKQAQERYEKEHLEKVMDEMMIPTPTGDLYVPEDHEQMMEQAVKDGRPLTLEARDRLLVGLVHKHLNLMVAEKGPGDESEPLEVADK